MFLKLVILFVLLPWVELLILMQMARLWGLRATLGLIVLTGVTGAALARHEGLAAVRRIRATLGQGRLPTDEIVDGLLILVAGIVLLTPGLITDSAGFFLLLPPTRGAVRAALIRYFRQRLNLVTVTPPPATQAQGHHADADADVIDVSADVLDDDVPV